MRIKNKKIYAIETSTKSNRKYPNVIWFPRSKTDPREIREVLKTALSVQQKNDNQIFNDKTLGETMAMSGSINVLGLKGDKYISAYKGKSTGDVSYITNARMLMRLFRFFGFVARISKGQYRVTDLGEIYARFTGDFPSYYNGNFEEAILLESLANFTFYSVNDDPIYRDGTFKIRPFVWLLYNLSLEPQCIFQLIVSSFASKNENLSEIKRLRSLLFNLRKNRTNLAKEWEKVGLNPNDYSCVHNFYDSAKILVYLGTSLGLIGKKSDPTYGRKITGKARHLKQASTFYVLTEKGEKYLKEYLPRVPIYYKELYDLLGDKNILSAIFILASLNTHLGNKHVITIAKQFLAPFVGTKFDKITKKLKDKNIEIIDLNGFLRLSAPLTFNFWQSVPPEIFCLKEFQNYYGVFIKEFMNDKSKLIKTEKMNYNPHGEIRNIISKFILDETKGIVYEIPKISREKMEDYVMYKGKEKIYGGTDRFSARISPTNSVFIVGNKIHVENNKDALDLLVPLNHPDEKLKTFIHENFKSLIDNFIAKSDLWEKDQHYAWVRNCFRLIGAIAMFSGSSGMLSRADVSITYPFIGGIEIKSPRENRGTINTKAIRQAVDAKIQVVDQHKNNEDLPRAAIAIGRRISDLAIKEEKKWAAENQPVLLINDVVLYYFSLKIVDFNFSKEDLVEFFTKNRGFTNKEMLWTFFKAILNRTQSSQTEVKRIKNEIEQLAPYLISRV